MGLPPGPVATRGRRLRARPVARDRLRAAHRRARRRGVRARAPCSAGCTRTASSTTSRFVASPAWRGGSATLAALDVVANNTDRKSGHVLWRTGRCWAIDNGLCFHVDDKLRTVIWEFAGDPISAALCERLTAVADGDVEVLRGLLDEDEVAQTSAPRSRARRGGRAADARRGRPLPAVAVADRLGAVLGPAHAEPADGRSAVVRELGVEVERRDPAHRCRRALTAGPSGRSSRPRTRARRGPSRRATWS